MSLPLKWEFPGGKIDPGESPQECLRRELVEELGITVLVGDSLQVATHHYETFSVTLYPFVCRMDAGEIVLHEHVAVRWLSAAELATLDWAAADYPVIDDYLRRCRQERAR